MKFSKSWGFLAFLLAVLWAVPGLSRAAAKKTPVAAPTPTPSQPQIRMKMEMQYVHYSVEGRRLTGYRGFRDLILPLGDAEATRLINKGSTLHRIHWFVAVPAVAGVVYGLTGPDSERIWRSRSRNNGRTVVFGVGVLLAAVSGLMEGHAQDCKFNAVQRYNEAVQGQLKVSIVPPTGNRPLVVGLGKTF